MKKTVLVLGACGQIGAAVTRNLLKEGFFVIASSKSEVKFQHKFREDLNKYEKKLTFYKHDLSDVFKTVKFIKILNKKYKFINYFVNCAGAINRNHFSVESAKEYQNILNVNFVSPMFIIKELISEMKKKKFGKIINLSSQMAKVPHPNAAPSYEISKSSINTLSRHLVNEYGKYNISINVISPGTIQSPIQKTMRSSALKKIINTIPSKKMGKAEDVANLVCYLFGPKSAYINGANINISGGSFLD